MNASIKYGWSKSGPSSGESNAAQCSKLTYPEQGWLPLIQAFSHSDEQLTDDTHHFNMSHIVSYFVMRSTKDHLPAGDFKSINKLAENLFRCGHVQIIEVTTVSDVCFVRCNCLPEMRKDRVYRVQMGLDKSSYDILNAECGCPAGRGPCGSCKYIGTLAYAFADYFRIKSSPELVTCTDRLQQWNRPRLCKVEPIPVNRIGNHHHELMPTKVRSKGSQMVFDPRPLHLRGGPSHQAIENLRCDLLQIDQSSGLLNLPISSNEKIALDHNYYSKLRSKHPCEENVLCSPDELPIVMGTKTFTAEDVLDSLSLSEEERLELEKKTRNQSADTLWFTARQHRITGSKCGRVILQKEQTEALLRFAIYPKPFLHIPKAIQWGKDNEINACATYVKHMQSNGHQGRHTEKAGFMVHPGKCWLGASPDAWVIDPSVDCLSGIAEFKCPFSMAENTVEEMCNDRSFYCCFINGSPRLKKKTPIFPSSTATTVCYWCEMVRLLCIYFERRVCRACISRSPMAGELCFQIG